MATEKYTKVNQDILRGFLQISVSFSPLPQNFLLISDMFWCYSQFWVWCKNCEFKPIFITLDFILLCLVNCENHSLSLVLYHNLLCF